jgi:hypothetical protein
MSHLTSTDLIFNKVNNKIVSAGFGINSILMNKGISPILSFTHDYDNNDTSDSDESYSESSSESDNEKPNKNKHKQKKQVFRSFKNLAIPINLFSMSEPSKISKKEDEYDEDAGHLPDNIYDELLKLVEFDNKRKRQSKKNYKPNKLSKSKKRKTYKNNK